MIELIIYGAIVTILITITLQKTVAYITTLYRNERDFQSSISLVSALEKLKEDCMHAPAQLNYWIANQKNHIGWRANGKTTEWIYQKNALYYRSKKDGVSRHTDFIITSDKPITFSIETYDVERHTFVKAITIHIRIPPEHYEATCTVPLIEKVVTYA